MKSQTGHCNTIACLNDTRKLSVSKNETDVVIDAGPWGKFVLPCYSKDWQEMVCLKLFLELGKLVDTHHIEQLLSDRTAGR